MVYRYFGAMNPATKKIMRNIFINLPPSIKIIILSNLKPRDITIEPINICNLKCPFCAVTTGLERPIGKMPLAKFRHIIDQVKGYVRTAGLYFFGESLLHPDIFEMVRYCISNGIVPRITTNGMFIDKHIDKIIASGLPALIIAIDGYNAKLHERYRIGSDFNRIVSGIKTLNKRKKELGSSKPSIFIQSLAFGYNDEEKMKSLTKEIGADGLKMKAPRLTDYRHEFDADKYRGFLPKENKNRRVNGMNEVPFAKDMKYCAYLRNPVITWDGMVMPCCFDWLGQEVLGNIFEKNLLAILRSKRSRKVLKGYFDKKLSICGPCDGLYTF